VNNDAKIKSLAENYTPRQLTALEHVADGVSLAPMELKKLNELGFKTDNVNINNYIEVANQLDKVNDKLNNNKAKIEDITKAKEKISSIVDMNLLNRSELSKYLNNNNVMQIFDKQPIEIIQSQQAIADQQAELDRVKAQTERAKKQAETAKTESVKVQQEAKAKQVMTDFNPNDQTIDKDTVINKYTNPLMAETQAIIMEDAADVEIQDNTVSEKIQEVSKNISTITPLTTSSNTNGLIKDMNENTKVLVETQKKLNKTLDQLWDDLDEGLVDRDEYIGIEDAIMTDMEDNK
jgi:hypothetical protein